jgi:hypothetical protein
MVRNGLAERERKNFRARAHKFDLELAVGLPTWKPSVTLSSVRRSSAAEVALLVLERVET